MVFRLCRSPESTVNTEIPIRSVRTTSIDDEKKMTKHTVVPYMYSQCSRHFIALRSCLLFSLDRETIKTTTKKKREKNLCSIYFIE